MVAEHWPFKNQSWSWLGLVVVILMLLAACGCGEARPPAGSIPPPDPSVGELLRDYGEWVLGAGIAALVLAAILALVLPAVRPFCDEIALAGAAALVCGASLIWLGDNPWVLWGTVVAAGAFAIWRYWPKLARYFRQVRA